MTVPLHLKTSLLAQDALNLIWHRSAIGEQSERRREERGRSNCGTIFHVLREKVAFLCCFLVFFFFFFFSSSFFFLCGVCVCVCVFDFVCLL